MFTNFKLICFISYLVKVDHGGGDGAAGTDEVGGQGRLHGGDRGGGAHHSSRPGDEVWLHFSERETYEPITGR